uniref:Uncharacterized protein n=1 Tax=Arundo donax TaxID=35708 RepID=A0A0A8ZRW0_ARUDO
MDTREGGGSGSFLYYRRKKGIWRIWSFCSSILLKSIFIVAFSDFQELSVAFIQLPLFLDNEE